MGTKLSKRSVLKALTKAQIVDVADTVEVAITRSSTKGALVDRLSRSRRASLERILDSLKKAPLQRICEVHELPTSGTKARLVERVLSAR
jgi:methionyl-tRNA formyltransferase